jgi:hypothetical protein
MPSDQQIAANRKNAKKSTGPRSEIGKRRSRRNAFCHGLAIDAGFEPSLNSDIDIMAKAIVSASVQETPVAFARQLAEAEVDLIRIRKVRAALFNAHYQKLDLQPHNYTELNDNLSKLERYERRAFSRSKRALRAISQWK